MTAQDNVLRSLLGAGQPEKATQAKGIAARKARIEDLAGNLAARAANQAAGLTLTPAEVTAGSCSLAEVTEHIPDQSLITIVEADNDRLGVVAVSSELMGALIEMQVFGRLGKMPRERRKPTRVDAAIASHFINLLLAALGGEAVLIAGEEALVGFRYASHLDDPRPIALMLEDRAFRKLKISLRVGDEADPSASIFLAVPSVSDSHSMPGLPSPPGHEGDPDQPGEGPGTPMTGRRRTLAAAMRHAPISLTAILCRRRISLAELRNLQPDSILAIPHHALNEVRLETANRHLLALGRLGEAEGFHAIRLTGRPTDRTADADLPVHEPPMGDLNMPDDFRPNDPIPETAKSAPEKKTPASGNAG